MSGLILRRPARKIDRAERRWSGLAFRLPHPDRRARKAALRVARLCERVGNLTVAARYHVYAGDHGGADRLYLAASRKAAR